VPPYFFSHLKSIAVDSYSGNKNELYMLNILLENALVLDEISITCSAHFVGGLEKQKNLYKQLIELPRGSQNCKIILG
jgi:hypothetical protein